MAITGSPTRNKMDGTQSMTRRKRGDKVRRPLTHWSIYDGWKRCSATAVHIVQRFHVKGTHVARNELDADNVLYPELPTVVVTKTKRVGKPGPRKNSLRGTFQREVNGVHTVAPLSNIRPKPEIDPTPRGPGIDEDGCRIVKGSDPIKNRKNIHTVEPYKFGQRSGPDVGKTKDLGKGAKRGGKRAPNSPIFANNMDFKLQALELHKVTQTKFFTAVCIVRNAEAKATKRIIIPRVRNKRNAIEILRIVHKIIT